jgi:hypothetical protein
MLALGALFALLSTGVWLYCLADIVLTPRAGCRHLPKIVWLVLTALTFGIGAAAWLLLGRPFTRPPHRLRSVRERAARRRRQADIRAALAKSRHPAGRGRVTGPDDDPEFLRLLDHVIRRGYDTGNEL